MSGYKAWQEGGPNNTTSGGPWFVTVPDGGHIEIGYDANGLPDEYHAKLFASAPALVKALAAMLDTFGGYSGVPACDEAIFAMQELGLDRWSMQSQMERSEINAYVQQSDGAVGGAKE